MREQGIARTAYEIAVGGAKVLFTVLLSPLIRRRYNRPPLTTMTTPAIPPRR